MKNILSIVIVILLFQNCKSVIVNENQIIDQRNNKINYFQFLTDDLEGRDPREKFRCMFPKFVNIDIRKDTSKAFYQKYPNPCSPSMYAKFIMYIDSPKSKIQINIINNSDEIISTFIPEIFKKGYHAFYSGAYLLYNLDSSEIFEEINIEGAKYFVEFNIDESKYKLNIETFR